MALGGGTFTVQNKILTGTYINFVSAANASTTLSDRGVVAMPFVADWGKENEVIEVTSEDFFKNSTKLFGYDCTHPQMQMFREIFKNAKKMYGYRLNSGAIKAKNDMAEAVCGGVRGNDITIVVENDVDNENGFIVKTLLENVEQDRQAVLTAEELKDNDFVAFKKDVELQATAGMPLTGGTDGDGRTPQNYQKFLDKIEKYSFHALGCNDEKKEIVNLFIAFTKRMREECGVKFQTVVYRAENADYEGVISLENKLLNVDKNLVEKTKVEVPILGQRMKGNKTISTKGTGTATVHYNISTFRKAMKHFVDTGEDMYFDMIVINNDPTSAAGRQTTVLKGCNLNKTIVAKVDANESNYMTEEFEFTFESWDMPEEFNELEGM